MKQKLQRWYGMKKDALSQIFQFTLPGLEGIPVAEVVRIFRDEIRKNNLSVRSKSIAFSFFLALFPTLIFIFSLVPYLGIRDINADNIESFLQTVLPGGEFYNFILGTLNDLLLNRRGGLLTGSLVLLLTLTSDGVITMMSTFDKSYEHYKKRNALQTRLIAFKITFLLVFLFLFSVITIVAGQAILNAVFSFIGFNDFVTRLIADLIRYILIVITFFLGISLIYYYGPATKEKYKFISPGATVTTILSILTSIGFSYYVSYFSTYNTIFGSIGTIMLLMIWFNVNAFVLLIGYEINAAIHYKKVQVRNLP